MRVSDVMTRNPQTLSPTDLLSVALEKMQRGRFSRLPVVDSGRVIGIVSSGDAREHIGYASTTRVSAAMREPAITVGAEATIETAAELMAWHKIGGLPVLDDAGLLVGIITERDLLHVLVETLRRSATTDARKDQVKELNGTHS